MLTKRQTKNKVYSRRRHSDGCQVSLRDKIKYQTAVQRIATEKPGLKTDACEEAYQPAEPRDSTGMKKTLLDILFSLSVLRYELFCKPIHVSNTVFNIIYGFFSFASNFTTPSSLLTTNFYVTIVLTLYCTVILVYASPFNRRLGERERQLMLNYIRTHAIARETGRDEDRQFSSLPAA